MTVLVVPLPSHSQAHAAARSWRTMSTLEPESVPSLAGLLDQLMGPVLAPVAGALAQHAPNEEILALVGFNAISHDPQDQALGIQYGSPPVATVLAIREEPLLRQITGHPEATLMVAALDAAQDIPWIEAVNGICTFLSTGKGRRAVLSLSPEALISVRHANIRR